MGGDYSAYLKYIVLFACILAAVWFFAARARRAKTGAIEKCAAIGSGSVSVLIDAAGDVTVIPYVKDKYGRGRALPAPVFLKRPYTPDLLGHNVRMAMKLCESGVPGTDGELMSKLGTMEWREFSRNKRNISIYCNPKHGLVFNTTRRKADGSYRFNYAGFERVLGFDAGDLELGRTILELLPRCR